MWLKLALDCGLISKCDYCVAQAVVRLVSQQDYWYLNLFFIAKLESIKRLAEGLYLPKAVLGGVNTRGNSTALRISKVHLHLIGLWSVRVNHVYTEGGPQALLLLQSTCVGGTVKDGWRLFFGLLGRWRSGEDSWLEGRGSGKQVCEVLFDKSCTTVQYPLRQQPGRSLLLLL